MVQDGATQRRRFEESVSFYLNRTLAADEQVFVEQYLREHPEAQAELVCWRELRESLTHSAQATPPDIGLAKLQARMRADRPRPRESLIERLALWVRPFLMLRSFGPGAFAVLGVLVLVQAGAILALLMRQPDGAQAEVAATRSLGKPAQASDAFSAKFRPGASFDVVSRTLRDLDISIVAGPLEGGRYIIKLPRISAAETLNKLSASGIIVEARAVAAGEAQGK